MLTYVDDILRTSRPAFFRINGKEASKHSFGRTHRNDNAKGFLPIDVVDVIESWRYINGANDSASAREIGSLISKQVCPHSRM